MSIGRQYPNNEKEVDKDFIDWITQTNEPSYQMHQIYKGWVARKKWEKEQNDKLNIRDNK